MKIIGMCCRHTVRNVSSFKRWSLYKNIVTSTIYNLADSEPFRFSTLSLYVPRSTWVTCSTFAGHLGTEKRFKYWHGKRISCQFLRKTSKWRKGCHLYHKIHHLWLAQPSWKWNRIATWKLRINLKPRSSQQNVQILAGKRKDLVGHRI